MIEQVAAAMGDQTDLLAMKPLLLRSDAGSVLARRVMAELIEKEKQRKRSRRQPNSSINYSTVALT